MAALQASIFQPIERSPRFEEEDRELATLDHANLPRPDIAANVSVSLGQFSQMLVAEKNRTVAAQERIVQEGIRQQKNAWISECVEQQRRTVAAIRLNAQLGPATAAHHARSLAALQADECRERAAALKERREDARQVRRPVRHGTEQQRRRTFEAQREAYLDKRAAAQRVKEQDKARVAAAREKLELDREAKRRALAKERRSGTPRRVATALTAEGKEARDFSYQQRVAKAADVKATLAAWQKERRSNEVSSLERARVASMEVMRTRKSVASSRASIQEAKAREVAEQRAKREQRRSESSAVVVAMAAASKAAVRDRYSRRFVTDGLATHLVDSNYGQFICKDPSPRGEPSRLQNDPHHSSVASSSAASLARLLGSSSGQVSAQASTAPPSARAPPPPPPAPRASSSPPSPQALPVEPTAPAPAPAFAGPAPPTAAEAREAPSHLVDHHEVPAEPPPAEASAELLLAVVAEPPVPL